MLIFISYKLCLKSVYFFVKYSFLFVNANNPWQKKAKKWLTLFSKNFWWALSKHLMDRFWNQKIDNIIDMDSIFELNLRKASIDTNLVKVCLE